MECLLHPTVPATEWFLLLFGAASFFVAWLAYKRTKEIGLQC